MSHSNIYRWLPMIKSEGAIVQSYGGDRKEPWMSPYDIAQLIFYLHGSNNALDKWGKIASVYTVNGYDIFMLDYRGYGKSQGKVTDENSLYQDIQIVFDNLKATYPENRIIVIGQSMGTALASYTAANNHPALLILQAPYYDFKDWTNNIAPELDTSNIPYSFDNASFLKKVKCPVIIFHGNKDTAVYYVTMARLLNSPSY